MRVPVAGTLEASALAASLLVVGVVVREMACSGN